MTPGPRALHLTSYFEGTRLHAYRDTGGVWTCGTGATGAGIGPGTVWTPAQCAARLATDIQRFVGYTVALLHNQPTTPAQLGALTDACYNAGPGNLAKSPMLVAHLAHDYAAAAASFAGWHVHDHAGNLQPGLAKRRRADAALYANDIATFDTLTGFVA